MARPANANAEETRGRILNAASTLFAEHGRAGASVRAIAQAAGVNGAMVSHYFGGKDGLYSDCLDALYSELAEGQTLFIDTLQAGGSVPDIVERTVRQAYRFAREKRGLIRLIMRHVLDQGEVDPERQAHLLVPFLVEVSGLLSAVSSRPQAELRLTLQSLIFLNVRYALSGEDELRLIAGGEGDVIDRVGDHLAQLALVSLGLTGDNR